MSLETGRKVTLCNMELAVLDTYKQMTGICGDCDGLKNDLKKKDGTDVTQMTTISLV
jgi:hypothetical protein